MSRYNILYYFLFSFLVMGAFASMAQNDYGLPIMGSVAFCFSIIFLVRLLSILISRKNPFAALEWLSLVILSAILGLRFFYVRFAGDEIMLAIAAMVLLIIHARKFVQVFLQNRKDEIRGAASILVFRSCVVLFLVSIAVSPLSDMLATWTGTASLGLFVVFIMINLLGAKVIWEEQAISPLRYVGKLRDASVILLVICVISTSYQGLYKTDLLPPLYSDKFPQAYIRLLNNAGSDQNDSSGGLQTSRAYKEAYEKFVERHSP